MISMEVKNKLHFLSSQIVLAYYGKKLFGILAF